MATDPADRKDQLIALYKVAALLKANDEHSRRVIRTGRLVMPYYSYRGQEIIPAALSAWLTDDDCLCTTYRGIHDMLAKGLPLKSLWAELAGRQTGACKGKGGPMHLTYPSKGIMVTTGIVGSTMPIANGLGWGLQIAKRGDVSVAMFGDGASNIGAFHESLNLAAVWRLPVIFVCQNNRYGEHTKYAKATSCARVADRAAGYGMKAIHVDGNDPEAMLAAAKEAVDHARSGEGPVLLEAMTFRFFGHVFGDDDAYMDSEEKAAAMAVDPVPALRARLIADGMADEAALAAIEAEVEAAIAEAIDAALAGSFPDLGELRRDVYAVETAA